MMKKLGVLLLMLSSLWSNAQQKKEQMNTISVTGTALVERVKTSYKAKIILNMEQVYYSDPTCKTLDEFKSKYFNALNTNGIDTTMLTENKMEFLAYGYQKEGTVLELKTSSEDIIKKMATVIMPGVSIQYQFKSELKPEQRAKILKESLANAKANANQLCKVADKKLGAIISISENSIQQSIWNSYTNGYEEYATIQVTYELN